MTTATVITQTQPLRLHNAPELSASVVGELPIGAKLNVLGPAQGVFVPVSFNGETGWAAQTDPSTGEQLLRLDSITRSPLMLGGIVVGGIVAAGIAYLVFGK